MQSAPDLPSTLAPAIHSATGATFIIGTLGAFTVTATGSPAPTLSESGTLPEGVSFTAATGIISGTPAPGTGHSYPITFTAHNGVGTDASQHFTLTVNETAGSDTQSPSVPVNLKATAISASQVNLTWTTSTDNVGVAGYKVFRHSSLLGTTTTPSYADTDLSANTVYTYSVAAYDAEGNVSDQSQPVTVTTLTVSSTLSYPVKVSSNGRYLVDQNQVPFLIVGDAPHSMFVNLSVADATTYMTDRAAHGINVLWVELLSNDYTSQNNNADGATFDGITPFTSSNDISTPNNAYFDRVDQMINIAASHGITIMLDAFETGGWMSFLEAQGNTKAFNWGVYLGNRYKNVPNIIWITGNDFQTWNTSSTDNSLIANIMAGIASVDSNHLQSLELNYDVSGSLDDTLTAQYVTLSGAYSYLPTYDEVLKQYNKTTSIPVMLEEAHYEFEAVGGCCGEAGTPNILRRQGYWTILSGGLAGQIYGNHYSVSFPSGWQNNMDSTGLTQLGYWKKLFNSIPWYNLVPDQTHAVVTAGFGTYDGTGALHDNTYATTARTADGNLIVTYTPINTALTVDMTLLSGPAIARWFDPTNGSYVAISGSPFSNTGTQSFSTPGNNTDGDPDWVLVLQVAAP